MDDAVLVHPFVDLVSVRRGDGQGHPKNNAQQGGAHTSSKIFLVPYDRFIRRKLESENGRGNAMLFLKTGGYEVYKQ
jgi:hypothetical protein